MSHKLKGQASKSGRSATNKQKGSMSQPTQHKELIDFSKKRLKHYTEDDLFKRVHNEVLIQSHLSQIADRLKDQGTLSKLHDLLKKIIEKEVSYSMNVLACLKNRHGNNSDGIDIADLLYSNIYIFKENFKATLSILGTRI